MGAAATLPTVPPALPDGSRVHRIARDAVIFEGRLSLYEEANPLARFLGYWLLWASRFVLDSAVPTRMTERFGIVPDTVLLGGLESIVALDEAADRSFARAVDDHRSRMSQRVAVAEIVENAVPLDDPPLYPGFDAYRERKRRV